VSGLRGALKCAFQEGFALYNKNAHLVNFIFQAETVVEENVCDTVQENVCTDVPTEACEEIDVPVPQVISEQVSFFICLNLFKMIKKYFLMKVNLFLRPL
jgi:hypothetical protein